ncbi:MAG: hypothetical protein KatS3mg129_0507 [Leptospiraceae bacterium]|nr:MAG: hypothetical protein KatS3mg129_0507 [Leptospiraceae bacterium]
MDILFHKSINLIYIFFIIYLFPTTIITQDFSWNYSLNNLNLKEIHSSKLLELSQESYKKGYYYHSIQYLTEFLERNPKHLEATKLLIKNYFNINDLSRAEHLILRGKNNYPEEPFFKIYESLLLLKKGKIDDAEKIISNLENLNLNYADFYLLKGNFYLIKNNYSLAEFYFKKYIANHPQEHYIYITLIDTYFNNNQIEKAKHYIELYKKIFKDNINIFKIQGAYYYHLYLNKQKKDKDHLYFLQESYINYKTYLNYIQYNSEIWNQLLNIAYLLNDNNKIKDLLNNYQYNIKDFLLSSNINELTNKENLLDSLENLCKKNNIFFSCIRYDFYIQKNNKQKSFERSKYYLYYAKKNKSIISNEEYYNILKWANFLYPENLELKKEFFQFYKDNHFYEDYFLTLFDLNLNDKQNPKWKFLMERFLLEKDKYLMFKLYKEKSLLNIKDFYKRNNINILVFNPFPIEQYEFHFRESNLIRNFINFYINQTELLKTINDKQWIDLKLRILNDDKYYLFYNPEIIPIIREWEIENNLYFDYLLETHYRIINDSLFIRFTLRDKNGLLIQSLEYFIKNNDIWSLTKILQDFLLQNITIKANFITTL